MERIVITCLSTVLLLSACSTKPESITLSRYQELQKAPPLKAREFKISWRLEDDKNDKVIQSSGVVRLGQKYELESVRELIYPTKFDLPRTVSNTSGGATKKVPITPTTPIEFSMRQVGDVLSVIVSTDGPFVIISGTLNSSSWKISSRSFGEAHLPIKSDKGELLTENKVVQPEITSIESFIHITGLPGKDHIVNLDSRGAKLVIRCDIIR